jgi:cobalt/nickel transport protein
MISDYKLEIVTAIAILGFIAIFLAVSSGGDHEFSGSDDVGSDMISTLSGQSVEDFKPLIPQYEPPSGEIESTLFALQCSFGAIILGLVFGYWLGQRKKIQAI